MKELRYYSVKAYDLHVLQGKNWELWLQKGRGEFSEEHHIKLRLNNQEYEVKNVAEEVYSTIMEEALSGKLDINKVKTLLEAIKSLT